MKLFPLFITLTLCCSACRTHESLLHPITSNDYVLVGLYGVTPFPGPKDDWAVVTRYLETWGQGVEILSADANRFGYRIGHLPIMGNNFHASLLRGPHQRAPDVLVLYLPKSTKDSLPDGVVERFSAVATTYRRNRFQVRAAVLFRDGNVLILD